MSFLVLVSLDLRFDFLTASVYRPVTFLKLLFLLENAEEIEVAEEGHCACATSVLEDLFYPSGGFLPP